MQPSIQYAPALQMKPESEMLNKSWKARTAFLLINNEESKRHRSSQSTKRNKSMDTVVASS